MKEITHSVVRQVLDYDQDSGLLTWREVSKYGTAKVGDEAGSRHCGGYRQIKLAGNVLLAHRVVWLWMTGSWPSGPIDHISGNRCDNRWRNLRDATSAINAQNLRGPQKNNTTGALGVTKDKKKFAARLMVDGKRIHIGNFESHAEASAAYVEAKRIHHPGCTI